MKSATPRRVALQLKIVFGLLLIALMPLLVSAILIDQIAQVAQSFASNEASRLRAPLIDAQRSYRELIAAKKDLFGERAARLASSDELVALGDPAGVVGAEEAARALSAILSREEELARITVRDAGGAVLAEQAVDQPRGLDHARWRPLPMVEPLAGGGSVELAFAADLDVQQRLAELGAVLDSLAKVETVRDSLPSGYRTAFLSLVGGVVLLVTLIGIILSRRLTGRIATLVAGTRSVAAGDLDARVELAGRDELAELAWAFNRMVEDLAHDRLHIAYLQRVGAWQDVARKLAHEIKNPLTPIQLAVQQCVSSYQGDDPRFRKLLGDAEEIVGEEIANLRRLVDAFRTLGSLPRVDARPLDVAVVIDDLQTEPMFVDRMRLDPPATPVTIRGDRLLLRRVLHNLIENGIQAGADGDVVVSWRADEDAGRAIITVDDAGPGIPADERERVFEPYITSKAEGTGLGLTIAKKIALDHGGALRIAPTPAPTGGARFLLSVPLAP